MKPTGVRDDAKYVARGMMTREQVKQAVRERDGHVCTRCGMTADEHLERHGATLHVHRVEPGALYSVAGCVTLCTSCHGQEPRRSGDATERDYASGPRKAFHAPAELFEAMDQYRLATTPQPSEAAILRGALEHFLTVRGYWPPTDGQ